MQLITQGKTNWEFLLIVLVLAVIVGGGILVRYYNRSYIKVLSPNGGERWEIGKTYEIRWEFKGPKDTKVLIILVDYRNPDKPKEETFAGTWPPHIPASAGKYSWKISPDIFGSEFIPGEKYKIIIEENAIKFLGHLLRDESDNYFSIVKKDETADWQIYRNEEYGFEFKYPQEWLVKDCDIFYPHEDESVPGRLNCIELAEESGEYKLVQIKVYNDRGFSLVQWFDFYENYIGWNIIERDSILIAGVEGVKGIYGLTEFSFEGNFLPKENKIYEISFWLGGMEETGAVEDKEKNYEQMLSTFRFLG